MSIRDLINGHLAGSAPELYVLRPVVPGDEIVRTMLISREINSLLEGPWSDVALERRAGRLRADLEAFVKGEQIGICLTPYKARTAYMGLLDPATDGHFDIRSRDPRPGIRVFGGFSETDTFVALTWSFRKPLGPRGSREWRDEYGRVTAEWRRLFPVYRPKTGAAVEDFVSANAFLV